MSRALILGEVKTPQATPRLPNPIPSNWHHNLCTQPRIQLYNLNQNPADSRPRRAPPAFASLSISLSIFKNFLCVGLGTGMPNQPRVISAGVDRREE